VSQGDTQVEEHKMSGPAGGSECTVPTVGAGGHAAGGQIYSRYKGAVF
jgi:hypothetical protein